MRLTPKQKSWLQEAYKGLGNFEHGVYVEETRSLLSNPRRGRRRTATV